MRANPAVNTDARRRRFACLPRAGYLSRWASLGAPVAIEPCTEPSISRGVRRAGSGGRVTGSSGGQRRSAREHGPRPAPVRARRHRASALRSSVALRRFAASTGVGGRSRCDMPQPAARHEVPHGGSSVRRRMGPTRRSTGRADARLLARERRWRRAGYLAR